ncbi:hypothetical protein ACOSQ4_032285 [Xanthoceras sorbifolium]
MVFVCHCWLCCATRRNSRATTSKAGSVVDELPPVEAMLRSALSAWMCCATVNCFLVQFARSSSVLSWIFFLLDRRTTISNVGSGPVDLRPAEGEVRSVFSVSQNARARHYIDCKIYM